MMLSNKSIRLNMYGVVLCFYFVTSFIHEFMPLVVIGMFIEFFDKKDKLIIYGFLLAYNLIVCIKRFITMPFLIDWAVKVVNLLKSFNYDVPIPDIPFPQVPLWLLIPILIVFMICCIAIMIINLILWLPSVVTGILLVKVIYGGMSNFSEAVLLANPNKFAFFSSSLLVLVNLEYLFLIPFVTHIFLKHIFKFYERIPQLKK